MPQIVTGAVPDDVADDKVQVAGLAVRYLRKGRGTPLLYVHDSLGNIGWLPVYDQLAQHFDVIVPDLAGYGGSDRPEWARSPRDLAILTWQFADQLGVGAVTGGLTVVGIGFGGFLAAEMASMRSPNLARLVLLGPVGIKPREGEIADQILRGCVRYGAAGFRDAASFRELFGSDAVPDDLYRLWDFSNEMTARVCWKPAMFSLELPHLLVGVEVPTLVVFGSDDHLVPLDVGRQYVERLPTARLEIVPDAGHWLDLEAPAA
ncbi:MAG: alpha/beta hydrolase, partial [Acidimicrobiia bacterium]|nr:alpha/beta hydrolase [Acidimicrobiia bacterium]